METGRIFRMVAERRGMGCFCWLKSSGAASGVSGSCSDQAAKIFGADIRTTTAMLALIDPHDAERLASAFSGSSHFSLELQLRNSRRIELTAIVDNEADEPAWIGTVEDITHRAASATGKDASHDIYRSLAENSPALLWMGDAAGKCIFLNSAQRSFWGVDPPDLSVFDWSSTLHPDDIEKLAQPFTQAMADYMPFEVEARYRRADGEYRTLRTDAKPRFDPVDHAFLGMSGVNTDITDRLKAEQHTRMLMAELNHRPKNILSVVSALARQTAHHASPEEFLRAFSARLAGLAASNDLLVKADWSGVEISELLSVQLTHLEETVGTRILLGGPSMIIGSRAAQTLGMAIHELSTNSLKYGALSRPNGLVRIEWETSDAEGKPRLSMSWRETGMCGVTAPGRRGFGSMVIVDMIAATLAADVELAYRDTGLEWSFVTRSAEALSA